MKKPTYAACVDCGCDKPQNHSPRCRPCSAEAQRIEGNMPAVLACDDCGALRPLKRAKNASKYCQPCGAKRGAVSRNSDYKLPMDLPCEDCGRMRHFSGKPNNPGPCCPSCAAKRSNRRRAEQRKPVPLEDTIAALHPEAARLFHSSSPYGANELAPNSTMRVVVTCSECGSLRDTRADAAVLTARCRPCGARKAVMSQSSMPKVSQGQREVTAYVDSLATEVVTDNAVGVIGTYHLDLYLPEARLAVEYNGDFWHSHKQKVREGKPSAYDYHHRKRDLCANKGITLAFVWEADWKSRQVEVKDALKRLVCGEEPAPILRRISPDDEPFELGLFALPEAGSFTT